MVMTRMLGGRWRRAGLLSAVASLAVLASACGGGSGGSGGSSAIQVGFAAPLSGPLAQNGTDETNGFRLGLKELGSTVNGHKINVTYTDTQANPATALTVAKNMVQRQHIQVFEGPLSSAEIAAVAPYILAQKVAEDDLFLSSPQQMSAYQKYGVGLTSGWDGYQVPTAGAEYAYKTLGWRHVTVAGFDFSFGWETGGAFIAEFKKLGGTIDKTIWIPNNATDTSSYVSAIPQNTQGVWVSLSGQVAVHFLQNYASFGLKKKIPIMGITQLTDQSALPAENPQDALGVYTDSQYCDGLKTPANQKFVREFQSQYHKRPGYYVDAGYTKAYILVSALKSLGKGSLTGEQISKAMRNVKVASARGPVSFSHMTWSPVQNSYICKVEKVNGVLQNVPIKTYPAMPPWGLLTQSEWMTNFKQQSTGRPSP